MDIRSFNSSSMAILNGFGHQVETVNAISKALKLQQVTSSTHSTFDNEARRCGELASNVHGQPPFGDVPPVAFLKLCKFV
jgi:hypothetical protein